MIIQDNQTNYINGYIKLYRKMLNWEWYTNIPVRILFEHCLLKANYQDKNWQGIIVKKGSFVTSYEKLSIETTLTVRQIRTAINKLKMTNELTIKTNNKYSIISINNWDSYQMDDTQNDNQMTNKRQTNDKQMTTTKEYKEIKKIKKDSIYGEFKNVLLNDEQYNSLKEIYQDKLQQAIEKLSCYIESSGKKYKNHYAVLGKHNWVYKEIMKNIDDNKNENFSHYKLAEI